MHTCLWIACIYMCIVITKQLFLVTEYGHVHVQCHVVISHDILLYMYEYGDVGVWYDPQE